METIIYREGETGLGEVKRKHSAGVTFVCPICSTKLIVALDDTEVSTSSYGKGIFCPNDLKHVSVRAHKRRDHLSFNETSPELRSEASIRVLRRDDLKTQSFQIAEHTP
jgi:hypothetical protein